MNGLITAPAAFAALTPASGNAVTQAAVPGCPNLSGALAAARDRCKAAPKSATNSFHHYQYAPADAVIDTASVALAGSGLALIPVRQAMRVEGTGSLAYYALYRLLYLSHSSGEFVPLEVDGWPVVPDKGRPLDKALATALTASLAYLLRDLLQMPRGTEDDMSARDDRQAPPTGAPAEVNGQQSQPPERYGRGPEGNAQPPASPSPAAITPEQRGALVALIQQHHRTTEDVGRMLASRSLKNFEQIPQALVSWCATILADGQISTAQIDRISALLPTATATNGSLWAKIAEKLQATYGVDRLALLTSKQADELEASIRAKQAAPKTQPVQPAATTATSLAATSATSS